MTTFYLCADCTAIIAVAMMLYLTEPSMHDTNEPPLLTLEQKVHLNLESAIENGYDLTTWTAEDIVADLLAFADELEEHKAEELLPHVITWKLIRSATS